MSVHFNFFWCVFIYKTCDIGSRIHIVMKSNKCIVGILLGFWALFPLKLEF